MQPTMLFKLLYAMCLLSRFALNHIVGIPFLHEEKHEIHCDWYLGSEISRTHLGFQT